MNQDYLDLQHLKTLRGYKVLEAIWLQQIAKIEEARDKAAQRGQDSAWRYAAGQEKGSKLIATALDRAIMEMEKQDADLAGEDKINKMLEELKLKGETNK